MRKIFFSFFLTLLFTLSQAQHSTFFKTIAKVDNSNQLRVIVTQDNGWWLFSMDSLKIYKFNNCGNFEWEKKYSFPGATPVVADIIATQQGGFIFLMRITIAGIYYPIVVNCNNMGNVLWSKFIKDNIYDEICYTLSQDANGNFFMYGNVMNISNNNVYNSLSKIDLNGNVVWSKLYNHGGIWGGAIVTSDNGVLMRTGNNFIKVDNNGAIQWSNFFNGNTYQYRAAVELSDGYIFNGYNQNGNNKVSFFKMDKSGNMLWGGKKEVDFTGTPQELRSKYNGNFMFLHFKSQFGKQYITWTEFNKDLAVVNQSAVLNDFTGESLNVSDIDFLNDSSALLAASIIYDPGVPFIGFIKTNIHQHYNCDTTLLVDTITQTASQTFITTIVTSRILNSSNQTISVASFADSLNTFCSDFRPLHLNLGIDTSLCIGSNLTLQNKTVDTFDKFLWSTGETSSSITVNQSGIYWLRVISLCNHDTLIDSIQVNFNSFQKPLLPSDTIICSAQPIVLDAIVLNGSYVWNDGSTDSKFYAAEAGEYSVEISYLNCKKTFITVVSDCEILTMPNVFTPNGDAVNNTFIPIEIKGIIKTELHIFNRWGQELFSSNDILKNGWDGKYKSQNVANGVYYWTLNYTSYKNQNKQQNGTVQLFYK